LQDLRRPRFRRDRIFSSATSNQACNIVLKKRFNPTNNLEKKIISISPELYEIKLFVRNLFVINYEALLGY